MKYAGKVDITRIDSSMLKSGESNKNVQPMDYTGDRMESLTRIGPPIKANSGKNSVQEQGVIACKMRFYQVCELRK